MNLYKQYLEVKKQHSGALVFFRVGDFYELFGQDAITASEILSLTLTGRDFGLTERVPMCGVPYHSVDIYIKKLVENGLKTAICEPANTELNSKATDNPKGKINLTATGTEQAVLLDYLNHNASDVLIEKINNGVKIVKDGKTLINKKTLETFLTYACEEARKISEKGARAACIEDKTVFGWLIHFFEEDSIEGTLYSEDGTEYKPQKPAVNKSVKSVTPAITPVTKPKAQFSLFDMLDTKLEEKPEIEAYEPADDELETEIDESLTENGDEEIPEIRQISETEYVDQNGVIYEEVKHEPVKTTNENIPSVLVEIFGTTLIMR